ncbi:zinc finger and BTB domain-containing protein 7A [Polypterus senegalus]|uniref:zinc finger and BTB domain-containing protein 7A n=1 Tax=Polypterus senegalus TaxID=55291 RepID=UPI0019669423|nr:zinc finger and BTB domain-containing protein 7A [Polypterus senegalus]XP_039622865.1 zinc finger and BTB domain-containing protein 7A [Polypterus senegalus]
MSSGGSGGVSASDGPIGVPFPDHSSEVLGGLNEQRQGGVLCDVLIIVQGQEFPAHRSVLAACSPYFHKLFTSGAVADRQSVYHIDFISAEALAALLEFAYTATLTVSTCSIRDILSAARLLEIQAVGDVCSHLLESDVLKQQERMVSKQEDQQGRKELADLVDQGNQLRAQEFLEFFQSHSSHFSSSCSTPDLRDLQPHQHLSQRNGGEGLPYETNGTATQEYYSSLALALAQPPSHYPVGDGDEEDNEEEEDEEEVKLRRYPFSWVQGAEGEPRGEAPLASSSSSQNGHYGVAGERGNLSASALLQQMMDSFERQKELEAAGEEVDGEEHDVEFYLNYFNSGRHDDLVGEGLPAWTPHGGDTTGSLGVKKMRSKAFQKCPICSKVIQGAGKLPRHIRTHTGEKPYECDICSVRFTSRGRFLPGIVFFIECRTYVNLDVCNHGGYNQTREIWYKKIYLTCFKM